MVILRNRNIHLHAVSRLAGTNCTHKPRTIETAQSTFISNALFCKSIKSQQFAYQFDFQFISSFRCIGMMHVNLHHTCTIMYIMYNHVHHTITYCTIFRSCLSGVFELACVVFFLQLRYPTVTAVRSASTILIYIYMQ